MREGVRVAREDSSRVVKLDNGQILSTQPHQEDATAAGQARAQKEKATLFIDEGADCAQVNPSEEGLGINP